MMKFSPSTSLDETSGALTPAFDGHTFQQQATHSEKWEQELLDHLDTLPNQIVASTVNKKSSTLLTKVLDKISFASWFFVPAIFFFLFLGGVISPTMLLWGVVGSWVLGLGLGVVQSHLWAMSHILPSPPSASSCRKAISYMASKASCPILKGRLSELYFLADHKNIDPSFWQALWVKYHALQERNKSSYEEEKSMMEERNKYRSTHLSRHLFD